MEIAWPIPTKSPLPVAPAPVIMATFPSSRDNCTAIYPPSGWCEILYVLGNYADVRLVMVVRLYLQVIGDPLH